MPVKRCIRQAKEMVDLNKNSLQNISQILEFLKNWKVVQTINKRRWYESAWNKCENSNNIRKFEWKWCKLRFINWIDEHSIIIDYQSLIQDEK